MLTSPSSANLGIGDSMTALLPAVAIQCVLRRDGEWGAFPILVFNIKKTEKNFGAS